LPFKESSNALGASYFNAERRLLAMERKFLKNPEFAKQYHKFMLEYLTLGHMELMSEAEVHINKPHFYLPHHAVCKEDSTTTKLRVVFDGSYKSSSTVTFCFKVQYYKMNLPAYYYDSGYIPLLCRQTSKRCIGR
jgi:hypothetical protein